MNQSFSKYLWLLPVALALAVYLGVLQNGFGWDDETILKGVSTDRSPLSYFFPLQGPEPAAKSPEPYYRPMVSFSYYLDKKVWGDAPFGFHLSVWLLHGLNTLLVYFLAFRWMSERDRRPVVSKTGEHEVRPYSLLLTPYSFPLMAAFLFAVHPIHAPAVSWIAGRNDSLCAAFLLAALLLYTYASRPIPYAFSMIAYLCALLTKEAAVFAFILFPLYDYLTMVSPPPQPSPLKGKGKDGGAVKKGGPPGPPLRSKGSISPFPVPRSRFLTTFVLRSIPPLALLAFYFAARAARITLVAGGASADTLTSGHSMANALSAAGLYFKLLVWPYPHHPFIGAIPDSLPVILVSGILLAAAAAGWGISLHRRNRPVGMAFGLMLLTLVPAVLVSFLRVASTPAAERYLYLPSAGFVILVAWAAQIGWRRLSSAGSSNRLLRYTAVLAAGGLLMLGGWQSWKRTLVWRDSTTFWEHAVASSPRLGFPYRELGKHYGGGKNFVQTEASYQQALAVDEKYLGAEDRYVARDLYLLGSLYYERGDFGKAEPFYKRALAIQDKALPPTSPRTADTLNNLALLYYNGKRYDEAEPLFQRAIAIYDQSPAGNAKKLADSLNNLAALYYGQGKLESAEPLYKRSMEIKEKQFGPESLEMASSYNNLAALYYNMKRYDDAEKLFHRALDIKEKRLNPDHPDLAPTLNNLASLAMLEGKYADAEALFQRTIRIREKAYGKDFPGLATTLENYAVLLRQMKRKEEADRMTARAKEIRNKAGKKQVVSGEQ